MNLRFFWNGIKAGDGRLQRCSYHGGALLNSPPGTITIYERGYRGFSSEIRQAFTVQNNSDIQTDYFEGDRIRVTPDHRLYDEVQAALAKRDAHTEQVWQKQVARSRLAVAS